MYFVVRNKVIKVYKIFIFIFLGDKWLESGILAFKNLELDFHLISAIICDKKTKMKKIDNTSSAQAIDVSSILF